MRSAPIPTLPLGLILGTTALLAAGVPANGVRADTITVLAEIQASCSVVAPATLNFEFYDGTLNEKTTQFSIDCGGETPVLDVTLGAGNFPNGGTGSRQMKHSSMTAHLPYALYDINDGTEWLPDTSRVVGVQTSGAIVGVKGEIAAGHSALPAGEYSDTVQITLSVAN